MILLIAVESSTLDSDMVWTMVISGWLTSPHELDFGIVLGPNSFWDFITAFDLLGHPQISSPANFTPSGSIYKKKISPRETRTVNVIALIVYSKYDAILNTLGEWWDSLIWDRCIISCTVQYIIAPQGLSNIVSLIIICEGVWSIYFEQVWNPFLVSYCWRDKWFPYILRW